MLDIGRNIVQGIADGITGAASAVWNALKGAVTGAIGKAKDLLGIHSPSALMRREVGYQMGAGMALGHEDAEPEVRQAASSTADAGVRAAAQATVAPSSAPGGGHSVTFYNCNFGDNSEASLRRAVLSILEGEVFAAAEPS